MEKFQSKSPVESKRGSTGSACESTECDSDSASRSFFRKMIKPAEPLATALLKGNLFAPPTRYSEDLMRTLLREHLATSNRPLINLVYSVTLTNYFGPSTGLMTSSFTNSTTNKTYLYYDAIALGVVLRERPSAAKLRDLGGAIINAFPRPTLLYFFVLDTLAIGDVTRRLRFPPCLDEVAFAAAHRYLGENRLYLREELCITEFLHSDTLENTLTALKAASGKDIYEFYDGLILALLGSKMIESNFDSTKSTSTKTAQVESDSNSKIDSTTLIAKDNERRRLEVLLDKKRRALKREKNGARKAALASEINTLQKDLLKLG